VSGHPDYNAIHNQHSYTVLPTTVKRQQKQASTSTAKRKPKSLLTSSSQAVEISAAKTGPFNGSLLNN